MGQKQTEQPPYEPPVVIVLGPVEELTLGVGVKGPGMNDGDGSFQPA